MDPVRKRARKRAVDRALRALARQHPADFKRLYAEELKSAGLSSLEKVRRDTKAVRRLQLTDRLFSRLVIDPGTGCLLWTGGGTADGYGQMKVDGRKELVHRVMYRMFVGEIPEGLVLDHVKTRGCTSRRCASPAHLEAVTVAENTRRGVGRRARLKAEAPTSA